MKISQYLPSILKTLAEATILFLDAPTGTGKSLGLPAALAMINSRVFVSVPTRAAVMNLYETQKLIVSTLPIEIEVGYAAESEVHYTDNSKIVYVTSGHLRRKVLGTYGASLRPEGYNGRPGPIDFCDVLMLDEIHNGSIDNYVNLGLWENAAKAGVQVPRLVLASATFPESLKARFTPEKGRKDFVIEGQTFPVEIQYNDRSYDPKDQQSDLYRDMATVIKKLITGDPKSQGNQKGNVLAFLPGSAEVQTLVEDLGQIENCDILTAFGAMKSEELQKIYEPSRPGRRKIIVATNIAETSITIDNLDIIVDSMLEKRSETSSSGGLRLNLTKISKDSARQRTGRTGRLRDGYCYRMITKEDFEKLEQSRPDEIHRLPLSGVILELISVGLEPSILFTEIETDKLNATLETLINLGCITAHGTITSKGSFVAEFPLSVRNALVLYEWLQLKSKPVFPALVTVALLDSFGPSYLWTPSREKDEKISDYSLRIEKYKKEYFESYKEKSDPGTFLNLWHDFTNSIGGYPAKNEATIKRWCLEGSINFKKWKEALGILKTCINVLRRIRPHLRIEIGPFTTDGLINLIRPIMAKVYSDMIFTAVGDQYKDPNGLLYKLDNRNVSNKLSPLIDRSIIALITFESSVAGRGKGIRLISIALDLPDPKAEKESKDTVFSVLPPSASLPYEVPKEIQKPGGLQWIPKAVPGSQTFLQPQLVESLPVSQPASETMPASGTSIMPQQPVIKPTEPTVPTRRRPTRKIDPEELAKWIPK